MKNNNEKITAFKSLHDISVRKEELLKDIRKDQEQMGNLWNEMFHPQQKKARSKGISIQSLMNTSIGVLDGVLFAWKLYRKFKRR